MKQKRLMLGLLITALLALGSCRSPESESAENGRKRLKVGLSVAKTFEFLPIYAGLEKGVWEKREMDVEVVSFRGDASLQQAFASKSIEMGLGSAAQAAAANFRGNNVKIVAQIGKSVHLMTLVARPEIRKKEDLIGKAIAVTSPGSTTDLMALQLSKHLTGKSDAIKRLSVGGYQNVAAALATGQVAAAIWTAEGAYEMEDNGIGKILFHFDELLPEYPFEVVVARGDVIEQDRELVERFLAGWGEAMRIVAADREYTVDLFSRRMDVPKAIGYRTYDLDVGNLALRGEISKVGLENNVRALVEVGAITQFHAVEKWVDFSFTPIPESKDE